MPRVTRQINHEIARIAESRGRDRSATSATRVTARDRAVSWKTTSLAQLQDAISALREGRRVLGEALARSRSAVELVGHEAVRIAREYDRVIDEDSEDYETDSNAMTGLEDTYGACRQVEDVGFEIGREINELIAQLEEIRKSVRGTNP